jgi:integrase/recombinase XerD
MTRVAAEPVPESTPVAEIIRVTGSDIIAGNGDQIAYYRSAWLMQFRSRHTHRAYGRDLDMFDAWCATSGTSVLASTRAHVDTYARQLEAAGAALSTVARTLSSLSSFYAYLVYEDVIARNPVAKVRRPAVDSDTSQTTGLDKDEAQALLVTARRDSPRACALVSLLLYDGLRVGEAIRADVADLGTERGHRVLTVVRKGSRRARVTLPPPVVAALDAYLDGRTDGPLFATSTGRRLDEAYIWRLVRRLAKDAGITSAHRICPHSLRHSFVTLSLDSGASLRDVQDAAGHADPRTTRRYDRARHSLDRHPSYGLANFLAE